MKRLSILILAVCSLGTVLLSSCNSNPAWTGPSEGDALTELARQSCACVYEVLDTQTDLDPDKIIAQVPDWKAAVGGSPIEKNKVDEVMKALEMESELADKIDNSSCMRALEEEIFNKGIDFEDLMEKLDGNCTLGLLYN